jgi:hypothetical protein
MESVRVFKDGSRPAEMSFWDVWDAPDWSLRPAHYYSDQDREFIRGVWANERRRGPEPLYSEDVNVGDQPAWTADGPIDETLLPTAPFGMGTRGSRTLKREITDPVVCASPIRDIRLWEARAPAHQLLGPRHRHPSYQQLDGRPRLAPHDPVGSDARPHRGRIR